ncbi:MAG: hypothetical protein K5746_00360 [Clostridiales bacterium]|nr:hypothetical protein [Clostridiales bacterium]
MSRKTEKTFRDLESYLEKHQNEIEGEADVERLVARFMQENNASIFSRLEEEQSGEPTADDLLELAEDAPSSKKRFEYIRKALALEPENLDAMRMEIETECGEDLDAMRERFAVAVSRADEIMGRDGWFGEENIGDFWGLLETRPYMRLRYAYFETLIACGQMKAAIEEAQELLRLCKGDNLGVRFRLMHIFAFLEEEDAMLRLHRTYEEYDETQMLLPLSIVCYKNGKTEQAREYLLRLFAVNPDTKKFMRQMNRGELDFLEEKEDFFGYRPFTMEELAQEFRENTFLFITCPGYFSWADRELVGVKGKPGRKKK